MVRHQRGSSVYNQSVLMSSGPSARKSWGCGGLAWRAAERPAQNGRRNWVLTCKGHLKGRLTETL